MKSLVCLIFFITCSLFSEQTSSLKGLNTLTFTICIPQNFHRKEVVDRIGSALKKHGKFIFIETKKNMNLSGFSSDAFGAIILKPISPKDAKEKVLQLSVSISAKSTIDKTKQEIFPEIWKETIFLSLNDNNKVCSKFMELLDLFCSEYSHANKSSDIKPVFYIYN